MKHIFLLIFCLVCLNVFSQENDSTINQNKKLGINFGALKTSYYYNNVEIKRKCFKSILFTNDDAKSEYKKGRTYTAFGWILGAPSMTLLFVQIRDFQSNPPITEVFIGSIIGTAGCILLSYIGEVKIKKSIKIYNKENIKTTLNIKSNSLGMSINFK